MDSQQQNARLVVGNVYGDERQDIRRGILPSLSCEASSSEATRWTRRRGAGINDETDRRKDTKMGGTSFGEMTKLDWWNFPRHENYLLIVFADGFF